MSRYNKYNLVYRLQKWMDTVQGQTFLNYAYSWGASVVILGALFKLTHLPGANIMLFIGMGTEVAVFFISAFDRPFDKTAEGRVMPTRMTDEYLEDGIVRYSSDKDLTGAVDEASGQTLDDAEHHAPSASGVSSSRGGTTIILSGGTSSVTSDSDMSGSNGEVQPGEGRTAQVLGSPTYVPQMSAEDAVALNEAQNNYVDELKELVETLKKVNEQSERLTRDSEEMENLNRTLTGISKVYEMQLKGASRQIGTIDQINEQTQKMAQQIEQLNQIYARMIEAMTVNMRAAGTVNSNQTSSDSHSANDTM